MSAKLFSVKLPFGQIKQAEIETKRTQNTVCLFVCLSGAQHWAERNIPILELLLTPSFATQTYCLWIAHA